MSYQFSLERQSVKKGLEVISLGFFTGNTFYPTMPYEVFEILVKEARFIIQDESSRSFSLEGFKDKINNTFSNNPPVISLNAIG